ncbi:MAG: EAL domain-containing protein [Solibacillus sp.]
MSIKKKAYMLSISIVVIAVLCSFTFHLINAWQHVIEDHNNSVTSINRTINEAITTYYEENPKSGVAEENMALYIPLLVAQNADFGAGYYLDKTNSFYKFGTQLHEDEYLEIQNNYNFHKSASSPITLTEDYYKGNLLYTYTPLVVNHQEIGYTWSVLKYDNLWTYFKGEILLVTQFIFLLVLITMLCVNFIFKDYKKKINNFKKMIRYSNIMPANVLNIPSELVPIYDEVNKTRADIVESERRFRDVVTAFEEYVWEVDLEGHYTYLSNKVESVIGYSIQQLLGKSVFDLLDEPDSSRIKEIYDHHSKHHSAFRNVEYTQKHTNGHLLYLCVNGLPIFDKDHRLIGYRGATRDISEEKKYEQEVQHLAFCDQLTQLPNRTSLIKKLEELLKINQSFALAFIDLDQFKSINDSLSHTAGDDLLKITADILSRSLKEEDSVYRFGGDEFIIVFVGVFDTNDIKARIHTVLTNFQQPIEIDGHQLFNTASIGISLYPEHGQTIGSLIKRADIAMYKSKQNGRNQVTFYSESFQENVTENFELANDLKDAIGTEQLFLMYQPQVDLKTNAVIGVEALLRWQHPQKGLISPEKFIRIAEEHGSILQLGKWVIEQACCDRKKWLDQGYNAFKTAINISIKQFEQQDFVEQVLQTVATCDLSSTYIELEITEGVAMNDPALVIGKLHVLKEEGFYIAIDDFGMGYSSLNYLKNLPIHRLKIDRSFITDLHNENDLAIVQSIISMAKSLQLEVVAEGVETDAHVLILQNLACDIAQGYYYAKPLSEEQLLAYLAK